MPRPITLSLLILIGAACSPPSPEDVEDSEAAFSGSERDDRDSEADRAATLFGMGFRFTPGATRRCRALPDADTPIEIAAIPRGAPWAECRHMLVYGGQHAPPHFFAELSVSAREASMLTGDDDTFDWFMDHVWRGDQTLRLVYDDSGSLVAVHRVQLDTWHAPTRVPAALRRGRRTGLPADRWQP